jgi:hypothetical protein
MMPETMDSGPVRSSNFIILLARQRSGTQALRSVLGSHRGIFCFNEVFNLPGKDSANAKVHETNYFTFLAKYAAGDVRKILPPDHKQLFLEFLEYLNGFTAKRYKLIDVKFNTTHFLCRLYKGLFEAPYLFDIIKSERLKVLVLTRRNYLRAFLSSVKAQNSGRYAMTESGGGYVDQKIRIEIPILVSKLEQCLAEDELVGQCFASYGNRLTVEYADVFAEPGKGPGGDFLSTLAKWLKVDNVFPGESHFRKQSSLTLPETIENYDEVAGALRDTKFAYCLEDEKIYGPGKPPAMLAGVNSGRLE